MTESRTVHLIAAGVVGVALVGFLRGVREPSPVIRPSGLSGEEESAPPAVAYAEMASGGIKANDGWQSVLADLAFSRPGLFDPVTRTDEMKLAALEHRAARRAFEGPPPVVPHPVDQRSAASCLACHGQGLVVEGRVAVRVSHPHFTNCTGCHVEADRGGLPWASEPAENAFVGIYRSGPGARAMAGSPPVVPHPTFLREDCLSCHGVVARPGIRTTHPYLTNCRQCHGLSASLDQVEFAP